MLLDTCTMLVLLQLFMELDFFNPGDRDWEVSEFEARLVYLVSPRPARAK